MPQERDARSWLPGGVRRAKRLNQIGEELLRVARLRPVINPPRIVLPRRARRQFEDTANLAQGAGAIASPPRECAQRDVRRLRAWLQFGGAPVRDAGGVELTNRFLCRAEKQLREVAQHLF